MSILDTGKAYVFSPVSVSVTMDGKPVVNAKVVRSWELERIETDSTTTDEHGQFSFAAVRRWSFSQMPLIEYVAGQDIIVTVAEKEYRIWLNAKRDTGINSELGGKPLVMTCELTTDVRMVRVSGQTLFTNCLWV